MSGAKKWSKAELKLLVSMIVDSGKKIDWHEVAVYVNRKARMCREKWHEICKTERASKKGIWNPESDKELIRLRDKGKLGWFCMSDYLDAEPMWLKNRYQQLKKARLERPKSVPMPMINRPAPEPMDASELESDVFDYEQDFYEPVQDAIEEPKPCFAGKRVPYGNKLPKPIEEPKPMLQYGGKRAWYGGKSPRVWE
jgi:hypothetical protein